MAQKCYSVTFKEKLARLSLNHQHKHICCCGIKTPLIYQSRCPVPVMVIDCCTKCHNGISSVSTYTLQCCGFLLNKPQTRTFPAIFYLVHKALNLPICFLISNTKHCRTCKSWPMNIQNPNGPRFNCGCSNLRNTSEEEGGRNQTAPRCISKGTYSFLLRSDSIVERGWDSGCRWHYKRNNEMML